MRTVLFILMSCFILEAKADVITLEKSYWHQGTIMHLIGKQGRRNLAHGFARQAIEVECRKSFGKVISSGTSKSDDCKMVGDMTYGCNVVAKVTCDAPPLGEFYCEAFCGFNNEQGQRVGWLGAQRYTAPDQAYALEVFKSQCVDKVTGYSDTYFFTESNSNRNAGLDSCKLVRPLQPQMSQASGSSSSGFNDIRANKDIP